MIHCLNPELCLFVIATSQPFSLKRAGSHSPLKSKVLTCCSPSTFSVLCTTQTPLELFNSIVSTPNPQEVGTIHWEPILILLQTSHWIKHWKVLTLYNYTRKIKWPVEYIEWSVWMCVCVVGCICNNKYLLFELLILSIVRI